MHQVMFSEARIELAREVKKHPPLTEILATFDPNDFEIQLAEICTYCKVVVHGDYIQSELDNLCTILFNRLRAKRGGIVICQDISQVHQLPPTIQ